VSAFEGVDLIVVCAPVALGASSPVYRPEDFAPDGRGIFFFGGVMYVKLFSSILISSVWAEDPGTRLVWITALAMADQDGFVRASPTGLARMANVPMEDCRKALDILTRPDPDSSTPDQEGRRLEKVDGGWHIVNYGKYRELRHTEDRREQVRQAVRRHRSKKSTDGNQCKPDVINGNQCKPRKAQADTYAEAEAKAQAEAKGVDTSVSAASSRGSVVFANPDHQAAYESVLSGARSPLSVDATIHAIVGGMHGKAYPLDLIGQAIVEILAANGTFSPNGLRAFCRKLDNPRSDAAPTDKVSAGRATLARSLAILTAQSNG